MAERIAGLEAKMARLAEEMTADIDKDTVDFIPNFDETTKEPTVLPAKFPFLLANGSNGIAVGMATNMPPHNLREIASAVMPLASAQAMAFTDQSLPEASAPAARAMKVIIWS